MLDGDDIKEPMLLEFVVDHDSKKGSEDTNAASASNVPSLEPE